MKSNWKKIWSRIGISGLIIIALFGNLIYMNVRSADPILPGWEDYDPARFEQLMKSGEPVLVEIYAPWCPTCLLQHEAFETLHEEGRAPNMRAIRVDFDRDASFINEHGFKGTGTLVIFQNGQQLVRASGLVTADMIASFISDNQPTLSR